MRCRAPRTRTTLLLWLLVAPGLAACGGDGEPAADSGSAPPPRPLSEGQPSVASGGEAAAPGDTAGRATRAAPADTSCPMFGLWRRCSVEERMERAGFGLTPLPGDVRQPGLAIAGAAYQMGAAELQLFLYADTAAARREAAALDAEDARPSAVRGIRRPPAVIHTANLVALFFNNNDRQRERVELALTAGLPAR